MKIELILESSEKNFFAKRYDELKLDVIANDLNIKKQTLYYYFKDKKSLYIETMKYSAEKYIKQLRITTENNNISNFVKWYIEFPNQSTNLFWIALQKWYCIDNTITQKIFIHKQSVINIIKEYFQKYDLDEVDTYLIMNLLEKLSQNNCIWDYCLKYDIKKLSEKIEKMIIKN